MRLVIGLILFAPLAVFVGFFAVENRAPLALEIWPFPGVVAMPASVWILGLLAGGLLVGMAIGWLSSIRQRRRARRAERQVRALEREIAAEHEDAAADVRGGQSAAPPSLSGPPAPARRAALIDG